MSVTWEGIFDTASCFDKEMALSMASFVGNGGGELERSVCVYSLPSAPTSRVVMERASLVILLASCSECDLFSMRWRLFLLNPDQSPDCGRMWDAGELDRGVRRSRATR